MERLVREGAQVKAFVRYNSRNDPGFLRYVEPTVRDGIEIVAGDLRDADAVRNAMTGCDTVLHLGALIAIPYSYLHPREVVEVNVLGTLNVLEAGRAAAVRRIVHTSTSEVYGTAQTASISESHALHGQSPYAAAKIGADKLVESYFRSFKLPVATIRPFNTFGPRQSARAVIPTIVAQALSGNAIKLGALDSTRDFTFVSDTVDGILRAAHCEALLGNECNLGTNTEISIREVVSRVENLLNCKLNLTVDTVRLRPEASEVSRLRSDNRKAREWLGWSPEITFDAGLEQVIAWVRAHPELYRWQHYEV